MPKWEHLKSEAHLDLWKPGVGSEGGIGQGIAMARKRKIITLKIVSKCSYKLSTYTSTYYIQMAQESKRALDAERYIKGLTISSHFMLKSLTVFSTFLATMVDSTPHLPDTLNSLESPWEKTAHG